MIRRLFRALDVAAMAIFYIFLSGLCIVAIVGGFYVVATLIGLFTTLHFLLYLRNMRRDQVLDAANVPAVFIASGVRSSTQRVHNSDGEVAESCIQSDSASLEAVSQPQSWWHVYGDGCTSSSVLSGSSHRDADLGIGGGDIDANPDQRLI